MSTTSACDVEVAGGRMDAATQSRSTPKTWQLVPHTEACRATASPRTQPCPWLIDFHTSACSGTVSALPFRLHRYTAPDWSVARQSSPLCGSAVATCDHVEPRSVDLYVMVPPCGVESYRTPLLSDTIDGSPPYAPTLVTVYEGGLDACTPTDAAIPPTTSENAPAAASTVPRSLFISTPPSNLGFPRSLSQPPSTYQGACRQASPVARLPLQLADLDQTAICHLLRNSPTSQGHPAGGRSTRPEIAPAPPAPAGTRSSACPGA